jgi:glycosyltransferase involved in cell wall biosynthesis
MNKKLKVIQLIDSLNPGGAEMMAVNIANGLAEEGIESHICATRLEGALKAKIKSDVGYLFLDKKKIIDFKALKCLYLYIKKNDIQIIHAHSSSYFYGFIIKLVNKNTRLIWHNHFGNSIKLPKRKLMLLKLFSVKFDYIISVNQLLKDWTDKKIRASNNCYLPNFAELSDTSKTTELKGEEGKRIVCLANLRKEKDHFTLLKAFNLVKKKFPDWSLHLVGKDLNDLYSFQLTSFIKNENLKNHVFLYGSCNDIQFVLDQATIGVLASKFEGLPVALLEYGLVKLPVVVTDVGECNKVVTNLIEGFVVCPEDEFILADGITKLINDEELRIDFGEKLFQKVNLNYSKENYIKQLISTYKSE